jgi:hypothetical protein
MLHKHNRFAVESGNDPCLCRHGSTTSVEPCRVWRHGATDSREPTGSRGQLWVRRGESVHRRRTCWHQRVGGKDAADNVKNVLSADMMSGESTIGELCSLVFRERSEHGCRERVVRY